MALVLVLVVVPTAAAHAVLDSAVPAPNGHVDEGLTVVEFRFTEDVERTFTSGAVRDANGTDWASGPVEFDEAQHNVIRLPVRPLPSGIYSASWQALSVDTHTTRGAFVFAVGDAVLKPDQYAPVVDDHQGSEVFADGFGRFAFFAGLFLALGVPLFALAVLRDAPPTPALLRTAIAFGAVGVAGAFVGLVFLGQRTGLDLAAVAASAPGRSIAWRGGLLLAATAALGLALARSERARPALAAALALGIGAVVATSLGSHAAAVKENTALLVAADALHLVMGAVWIGGVVSLVHVGWGRSALEVAAFVYRFSPLAVASVVVLLATGALASVVHMPCFAKGPAACLAALPEERYMQLVAAKLALMAPLILIGAYHKYRAGPRLAKGTYEPSQFRRLVQVEAGVMALVLLAAGVLAASAPPQEPVERATPDSIYLELQNFTRTEHVIVQIAPNPVRVGAQELTVQVHPLGQPLPNATVVGVYAWPVGGEKPETQTLLTKVAPGAYELRDGIFTSPGDWNLLVALQTRDYSEISFVVPVQSAGAATAG